jgi:WD40 repeat protein
MIRLWDVVTKHEILDFEEHVGNLRHVAFSADGRSLAGAGLGVVRVWQASADILVRK